MPRFLHVVGARPNFIKIDSLLFAAGRAASDATLTKYSVEPGSYGLVTLNHPASVDDPETLSGLPEGLEKIGRELPLLCPAHPRTTAAQHSTA